MDREAHAKLLAHITVSSTTGYAIQRTLGRTTNMNPWGIPAMIIGGFIGELIAMKLDPWSDAAVDKLIAWLQAYKAKKNEEK